MILACQVVLPLHAPIDTRADSLCRPLERYASLPYGNAVPPVKVTYAGSTFSPPESPTAANDKRRTEEAPATLTSGTANSRRSQLWIEPRPGVQVVERMSAPESEGDPLQPSLSRNRRLSFQVL